MDTIKVVENLMLPYRWERRQSTPYSIQTPLLDHTIRRSDGISVSPRRLTINAIIVAIPAPILMMLSKDSFANVLIYILLLIAWIVLLVTMSSATILAATSTFAKRKTQHFQLLWMSPLSNRELGNSLCFDVLYRLRWMLLLTLVLAPTIITGMIEIGAWKIESCEWLDFANTCDPWYPRTFNYYSSTVYGILIWLVCFSLIFTATMTSIAFTFKWNIPLIAAALSTTIALIGLGFIIYLSITTITPHISTTYGWGSPLTVILLLVLFWQGWLLLLQKPSWKINIRFFVIVGWCICAAIAFSGLIFYPSEYRPNLIYLELIALLPQVILTIALFRFWKGARTLPD